MKHRHNVNLNDELEAKIIKIVERLRKEDINAGIADAIRLCINNYQNKEENFVGVNLTTGEAIFETDDEKEDRRWKNIDVALLDQLRVGDSLHASCSDEIYATIASVCKENATIDLFINDINDLLMGNMVHIPNAKQFPPVQVNGMDIEHLKNDNYKFSEEVNEYCIKKHGGVYTDIVIVIDTPGDGCYRCTKSFTVLRAS